jgi:transcriptional regulator with XRE-family HTH domain
MPAFEDLILSLAGRIQMLRKNLGMTQATLARRAGVTVETVARLERVTRARISANSNPSLETMARLAIALEVEVHELLAPQPVVQRKNDQFSYMLANASPAFTQRLLRVAEVLFQEEQELVRHSGVYAVGPRSHNAAEAK